MKKPPAPPHPASTPSIFTTGAHQLRILLVDDHPILLEGLTASINSQADMTVCGSAASARAALQLLPSLKPNLLIVDISLEDSHGLELVKDLAAQHPEFPVLILSTHDETLYAERALRAGARGYVMKREPMHKLLAAIRKVASGGLFFSESTTARLLNRFATSPSEQQKLPVDRLSDRELEILELTGQGKRTRQIADALHISIKTVQAHREHIKVKLEMEDGVALARFAINWVESRETTSTPIRSPEPD